MQPILSYARRDNKFEFELKMEKPMPRNMLQESQLMTALSNMKTDSGYFSYGSVVWDALNFDERETLKQLLFQGPVYDGAVISKSARDSLIDLELAVRCCFMGEQGYTAATYLAYSVFDQSSAQTIKSRPGTKD